MAANLEGSPCVHMVSPVPTPAIIADSPDQFHGKLRLSRFAVPSHYELHFHPNLVSSTFSGVVSITVSVLEPTRFLVLNVVELTIDHASIHFKCLVPTEVVFFKDDQIMVLGFAEELPLGEGVLRLHFNGILTDEMRGFHRSKYQYKGEMAYMAVTVFEPVSARRCFPCWDEPVFKVEIHHTNEIDKIFDDIIYIKGASILRMLERCLGANRFQKALASYIKKYAYSNAKTEDLWAVLVEETGEPLKDLMTPWTKQSGYPVISVKHEGTHIQLEQAQFVLDGSSRDGLWVVPITLRCGSSTKKFLLKDKYDKLDVCGKQEKHGSIWIKLNINESGFYRVKYDKEIAATLQNALEANEFSSMEKIGIVENSLVLSMSLKDTLASLLHILYACREEANYTVLKHTSDITAVVAKISIDATPYLAGDIKQLLIKILLPHAVKLGCDPKDSEDDLDVSLRQKLLVALVELGHDKTINEGLRRFDILIHDHNSSTLPPHTRTVAYLSVMQKVSSSNRSGYDALRQVYKDTTDGEEKLRVLGVLSSCPDKDIVLETLNLIFTNEVPNKDAVRVLKGISIEARETAWSWLKENWDGILKVVPASDLLWSIVNNIVPLFTSNDEAEEISKFLTNYMEPALERALKGKLEMVQINMRWIDGIQSETGLAHTVHRP